jgi:hypothetical protein
MICEPGEFHTSFDARLRSMAPFGIATAEAARRGRTLAHLPATSHDGTGFAI